MTLPVHALAEEIEDPTVSVTEEIECDEIDILEEYVTISEAGNISIDLPEDIASTIDADAYSLLLSSIEDINNRLDCGELEITKNGTIYETDDEELVVQGGNVNKIKWYWWGIRRYASNSVANEIVYNLNKLTTTCGTIGTVSGFGLGTPLAPIALAGTISSIYGIHRASSLSNDISYYNSLTNRGVIIDLRWVITFKVRCQ